MEVLAAALSDQDMLDIAAYYAALSGPLAKSGDAVKIDKGQQIEFAILQFLSWHAIARAKTYCPFCRTVSREFNYSAENIRSVSRIDMDGAMGAAATGLSNDDNEAIVAYAVSLK